MKFYDKGFINTFDNYTQVQVFSVGTVVLDMKIYKDNICSSTFECMDLKSFNKLYLHESYKDNFLRDLFNKNEKNIVFRDKKNRVLIKIKRD